MGAWGDYTYEDIGPEDPAGSGAGTAEINLAPGEKAQIFVTRTDGASNGDAWRIAIEGSIEDTPDYAQDPPLREYRLTDTQLEISFLVVGIYAFRIWIENDEDDNDAVAATVGWRKDGVSI